MSHNLDPVDLPSRENEKTNMEAEKLADIDFESPDIRRFLHEIYKEAYNAKQQPDARIAKVLMKFSAMTARVSSENDKAAKTMLKTADTTLSVEKWTLAASIVVLAVSIYESFK